MNQPNRYRRILATALPVTTLLLMVLACNKSNMTASEIPEWVCPSPTPIPECLITPSPEVDEQGTPGPVPTYDYPSECFLPTATPFVLHEDFRLGRKVRIGSVNGIGMGIWVTMDNVEVTSDPFLVENFATGVKTRLWVTSWDVKVINASWNRDYEFYPFSQFFVLTIDDEDGNTITGAWTIDNEAFEQVGLEPLTLDGNKYILHPGEQITYRVAAYIPGTWPRQLAYILDPLDRQKVQEMVERGTVGSNVGVWITDHELSCPYDDINPPGNMFADPGEYVPGYLLTRHPVEGVAISRGYGCNEHWTGFKDPVACPDSSKPWFHPGIDYAWASGSGYIDPLPGAGVVVFAGVDKSIDCSSTVGSMPPHTGFGNYVKHMGIVEGHTVVMWGGHMSSLNVRTASLTQPGQVLAQVGSTGCSTGPHVHFQVKVDGRLVNPLLLIPPGSLP